MKIDFIGVGAAKAGTSWLSECLGQHPQICLSQPKELNYFCERKIWPEFRSAHRLGPKWLGERFGHCPGGKLLGEFSPSYLCDPRCPDLIFEHNPGCRLIFSFRHPVEASFSFYHQIAREAVVPATFAEFVRERPEIRRVGLYHQHVRQFLGIFPPEQCLFLLFDDIQHDPLGVLRQCFTFLRVKSDFVPASATQQVNQRKGPRSRLFLRAMYWMKRRVENSGAGTRRLIWKLQLHRLHQFVMQRSLKPVPATPMEPAIRQELLEFYRHDTSALAELLGRDLSHWQK